MRAIHDIDFIRGYASYVQWRGIWMQVQSLAVAFVLLIPFIFTISAFRYGFMDPEVMENLFSTIDNSFGVEVGDAFDLLLFRDWPVFLVGTAILIVPMINAHFRFWRFLAESQMLVATAETAFNTSSAAPMTETTGAGRTVRLLHWVIPLIALFSWAFIFWTYLAAPGALRLVALHPTAETGLYVMEFNSPPSRYSSVEVAMQSSKDLEQEAEITPYWEGFPQTLQCRSRWMWLPVEAGVLTLPEPNVLHQLDIAFAAGKATGTERARARIAQLDADPGLQEWSNVYLRWYPEKGIEGDLNRLLGEARAAWVQDVLGEELSVYLTPSVMQAEASETGCRSEECVAGTGFVRIEMTDGRETGEARSNSGLPERAPPTFFDDAGRFAPPYVVTRVTHPVAGVQNLVESIEVMDDSPYADLTRQGILDNMPGDGQICPNIISSF